MVNLEIPNKTIGIKTDSGNGVFCEFYDFLKNNVFTEHLRSTASVSNAEELF